jgi:EmrB/QacA subfamily drug resistance transporter
MAVAQAGSSAVAGYQFPSERMSRRELTLAIAGLLTCLFLAAIDTSIVNTALPTIAANLRGFDLYPWVTTGYLLTSTAVVPVAGKLGDRYGRRPMLIGGVIYFLAITTLCGLAQDMPQLIALRALQGVGGGILMAAIFSSMGELLTPIARARISGLITATFSAANLLGPLIGGLLTDAFSWRAIFYANIPFGLLALAALWRSFPDTHVRLARRPPIDLLGAIVITVATVLLLLALSWGGREYAWASTETIGLFGVVVLLLALFVRIESRAADPVVPLWLFRNNVIGISGLGSLVHQMGSFGIALFIPLFIQGVLGASATVSGGLLIPMVAAMLLTNIANGLIIAQTGRYKAFLISGFAIGTAAFILLTFAGADTTYLYLVGALVVFGIGSGFLVGTLNLAAQNAAPLSQMGVVTAFSQYSRSMGGTLGSAILGSVLLARLGPLASTFGTVPLETMRDPLAGSLQAVFLVAAGLMAIGLIATIFIRELPMRGRRVDDQAASPTPAVPYRQPAPASGAPRPH